MRTPTRPHTRSATALAAVLSIACWQTASAGTITTYDRVTFQTALSSATLLGQDFDALPSGPIGTVNGVTYTPSAGSALVTSTYLTTSGANGLGSTSVGFFQTTETLTLTFATAITAFAIDVNTFAPLVGSYQVELNDGSGSVVTSLFDVFPGTSTGQFIGFTDTSSFTTVVLSALQPYSYTVDTLAYGEASGVIPVPEASTWALLGMGLPLLVAGTVRRRRASRWSAETAAA